MDALDKVIGLGPAPGPADGARFIPSKAFAGPRDGYVFRTSDLGTGYHQDAPAADSGGGGGGKKKRARPDGGGKDDGGGGAKKPSIRFGEDSVRTIPARRPRPTGDELLAAAEEAEERGGGGGRLIDPSPRGVRSACAALGRVHRRNQLLRAEHADSPERFMTSELALNDDLLALGQVAVNVGLYREVVGGGAAETLLACLSHENSDVAMAVVNTLTELLDPSLLRDDGGGGDDDMQAAATPEEKAENMALLANSFVEGGGIELLSSNLGRFDESVDEEARGTEDALTLVENLLDLDRAGVLRVSDGDATRERKSVAEVICRQSSLVPWLLRRMDEPEPDGEDERAARLARPIPPAVVRLHSSEVLSAILQHEDYAVHGPRLARMPKYSSVFDEVGDGGGESKEPARTNGGGDHDKAETVDGIEVLLLAIAAYRKSDPEVEVDCEYLENVFDALSASLLRDDNVSDFVEAEGIELMLRCLRQKVHSGGGALKVLSFCLSGSSSGEGGGGGGGGEAVRRSACEAFVGAGGIKTLFPLFMARRSAMPCPAACSEGGSRRKGEERKKKDSKGAKRAAQARRRWLSTVERNSTDVMYALTRHASPDSAHDARSRILAKFVEEDCEKCDRAVELCLKNDERARLAEYQFYRGDGAEDAELLGGPDAVDLAALGAKLRGGGDAFHRCCAILGFACVGSRRCRGHVMDQLRLQGSGITVVKDGLAEFAGLLSEGAQKAQIEGYIDEL